MLATKMVGFFVILTCMNIPKKKLKSGLELDVLAFGTWLMGGAKKEADYSHDEREIKAIQKAYELGMRRFDTAELYGVGHAEELLGKALKGINRKELFITSKVKGDNLAYKQVLSACEGSLNRLETDYLDLYLLHWTSDDVPIAETMQAMDELLANGKIKNIGISNFSTKSTRQAQAATRNKIVLNQVHYNLIFRQPEREGLLDFCQKDDIFMEAWRPIEKGFLAEEGSTLLDELAKKYEKTPVQVAINWLISQENVLTLFKASNPAHTEENLGALGWNLASEDVGRLREEFPNQREVSDAVPLE